MHVGVNLVKMTRLCLKSGLLQHVYADMISLCTCSSQDFPEISPQPYTDLTNTPQNLSRPCKDLAKNIQRSHQDPAKTSPRHNKDLAKTFKDLARIPQRPHPSLDFRSILSPKGLKLKGLEIRKIAQETMDWKLDKAAKKIRNTWKQNVEKHFRKEKKVILFYFYIAYLSSVGL